MYLSLLKWNIYSRVKRRVINLKIVQYFRKEWLIMLFVIFQVMKVIGSIYVTNLLLYKNYITINNIYIDSILENLQGNSSLMIILFGLYIMLNIYQCSIRAVKLKEDSKMTRWFLANTNVNKKKLNITLLLEEILWSFLEIITFQVPILSTILIYINHSYVNVFIIVILYVTIIMLITLFVSLIYNNYLYLLKNSRSLNILYFKEIVIRVIDFGILYFLGTTLSLWISKFPLVKRNIKLIEFQEWENSFGLDFFQKISIQFEQALYIVSKENSSYLITMMIGIIILLIIFNSIIIKFSKESTERSNNVIVLKKKDNKSGVLWYNLRIFLNSDYTRRNISSLFGSVFYWSAIGFFSGVLRDITPDNKVYYFVVIASIFYPIYFLVENIFQNLSGKYCLDGEGKNIYFWLNKNIFYLYQTKRKIFLINTLIIVIISNTLMILTSNISIKLELIIFLVQAIFIYTLYNLFSIPSIIFPHFEYSNIEELNKYKDKKELNNTLSFIIVVIFIPIIVLPTAFYLTEYINELKVYIIIQFLVIGIILLLVSSMLNIFIKRKVTNKQYIFSIFEK